MKSVTLFTLFISLSAAVFAGPTAKFAYHTVEKGETLYSISRQYGIKPAELASYNEAIGDKLTIKIGQKLKVPSTASAPDKEETPQQVTVKPAPKPAATTPAPAQKVVSKPEAEPASASTSSLDNYHIVKKGETFYSISRQYNVARTDLQMWNDLDDMNIKIGQKLLVKKDAPTAKETPAAASAVTAQNTVPKKEGYNPPPVVVESNVSTAGGDVTASSSSVGLASTKTVKSWKNESASERMEAYRPKATFDPANEYESLYYQNVYSGLTKKSETGVAKLMTDNNTSHVVYYNSASVGTIMKITNTDNGKTTYALVIGKVPPAENNTYLVKMSEKVARNLSIKDYNSVEVVCYTGSN